MADAAFRSFFAQCGGAQQMGGLTRDWWRRERAKTAALS